MIQSLAPNSDRLECVYECIKIFSPVILQILDVVLVQSRLLKKVGSFIHVSKSTWQTFTGQVDKDRHISTKVDWLIKVILGEKIFFEGQQTVSSTSEVEECEKLNLDFKTLPFTQPVCIYTR